MNWSSFPYTTPGFGTNPSSLSFPSNLSFQNAIINPTTSSTIPSVLLGGPIAVCPTCGRVCITFDHCCYCKRCCPIMRTPETSHQANLPKADHPLFGEPDFPPLRRTPPMDIPKPSSSTLSSPPREDSLGCLNFSTPLPKTNGRGPSASNFPHPTRVSTSPPKTNNPGGPYKHIHVNYQYLAGDE